MIRGVWGGSHGHPFFVFMIDSNRFRILGMHYSKESGANNEK